MIVVLRRERLGEEINGDLDSFWEEGFDRQGLGKPLKNFGE
jgi:hypothetical protein